MNFIEQEMPKAGDTVAVGLSGGVDSTLTAMLLKEKGCHVIGVTMSVWDGRLPENVDLSTLPASCYGPSALKNIEDTKKFCAEQNIEYHVIDVKDLFRQKILNYFTSEYRNGRTPNPCIQCNCKIKFGALIEGIERLGINFDYFCTGHYARIVKPEEGLWKSNQKPCMIQTASDASKDQTYFLYRIPSQTLEKVRFPLAGIKKSDVFKMAKERNLAAADKAESQDFAPEQFRDMFFSDKPSVPGKIIDLDGKELGYHNGIEHYTVGQRRGLGIALSYPVYVHSIDASTNTVILAKNEDLNCDGLYADDFVWPANIVPPEEFEAFVKIRLASKPVKAKIIKDNLQYKVIFENPQRAVAPGQSLVIYTESGVILGGGIIKKAIQSPRNIEQ